MEIAGLVLAIVSETRTLPQSLRNRFRSYTQTTALLQELDEELLKMQRHVRACETDLDFGELNLKDLNAMVLKDELESIQSRFKSAKSALERLQGKTGGSKCGAGARFRIKRRLFGLFFKANQVRDELIQVSRDFDEVAKSISSIVKYRDIAQKIEKNSSTFVDDYMAVSTVPALTDREVLEYDGVDEHGDPTPESKLKSHILESCSETVAAAGVSYRGRLGKLPSAEGMAGVGKTVALKGLAFDEDIQSRFEAIHFISLGHDATDEIVVSELANIVQSSGGENKAEIIRECKDAQEAVRLTAIWFSNRPCLFLVDDVWRTSNRYGYFPLLRQLLSRCELSRMVITTRDREIALEAGQRVEFGVRDSSTSLSIFESHSGIDRDGQSDSVKQCIERILRVCNGLPMALGVAAMAVRNLVVDAFSVEDALVEYVQDLEEEHKILIDEEPAGYRSLKCALKTSLDLLDREQSRTANEATKVITGNGMTISQLYTGLCVMKSQAWAPMCMLRSLWGLGSADTKAMMRKLCNLNLVSIEWRTVTTYRTKSSYKEKGLRLHDLQLQYCQEQCGSKDAQREWHERLLNGYLRVGNSTAGYGSVEVRPWWSEEVEEDGYIHENLARHLVECGREEELKAVLLDARWTKLRRQVGGIVALEADFGLLESINDAREGDSRGIGEMHNAEEKRVILNALRCSWQSFVEKEHTLAAEVSGRLLRARKSSAAARKYVESVIEHSARPCLEALSTFLPDTGGALVNEIRVGKWCSSVAYSTCGQFIAASTPHELIVVDIYTNEVVSRFNGHGEILESVCFLPHSTKIVAGYVDHAVRIWNMKGSDSGVVVLEAQSTWERSCIVEVCASGDGSRIACASAKTVRLWDVENGIECKVQQQHKNTIYCVCICPNGELLAAGGYERTIRLWNARTGELTGTALEGHTESVRCVAFSPDCSLLASGSDDGTVRLWNVDSGALVKVFKHRVRSVDFSPDGKRIVCSTYDKTVQLLDVGAGGVVGVLLQRCTHSVNAAVFSPEGTQVASGSEDGTVRIWDVTKVDAAGTAHEDRSKEVWCVSFSTDGRRIATGSMDGMVQLWDSQNGVPVSRPLKGHTRPVLCVEFSRDGSLLVSGSEDKTVRVWDATIVDASGTTHEKGRGCLRYSLPSSNEDGGSIATGSFNGAKQFRDFQDKIAVGEPFKEHDGHVTCVAISRDGSLVASGSEDGTICVWNVSTRVLLFRGVEGHIRMFYNVEYVTNSFRCVSKVSDEDTRRLSYSNRRTFDGDTVTAHYKLDEVSFNDDGTKLISSSCCDDLLCVWAVPSGKSLWVSWQSSAENVLNIAEAKAIIEECDDRFASNASDERPFRYCDHGNTVVIRNVDVDLSLVTLQNLGGEILKGRGRLSSAWKYIAKQKLFVAVLANGQIARFRLHT